jgi:hypothetical protein
MRWSTRLFATQRLILIILVVVMTGNYRPMVDDEGLAS